MAAVETFDTVKNCWIVVSQPTSADRMDNRVSGVYHDGNGGFAAAEAQAKAIVGPPDNHYRATVLGPGSAVYKNE